MKKAVRKKNNKGSKCAKIAQAASSAAQLVCTRSTDRALQTRRVNEACTRSTAVLVTSSRSLLSVKNYQDGGQHSTGGEAGLEMRTIFWNGLLSSASACCSIAS